MKLISYCACIGDRGVARQLGTVLPDGAFSTKEADLVSFEPMAIQMMN
jgi:hypothetical protein